MSQAPFVVTVVSVDVLVVWLWLYRLVWWWYIVIRHCYIKYKVTISKIRRNKIKKNIPGARDVYTSQAPSFMVIVTIPVPCCCW